MEQSNVIKFISKRKTAFLASVNAEGFPVVRAMLAPRKIEQNVLYFTTNTSSRKVKQFLADERGCVYFYRRGLFRYRGVCLLGRIEVCTDLATKEAIWRAGDKAFYREGVTDPDYCVLKVVCQSAEYYCDLKTESIIFN